MLQNTFAEAVTLLPGSSSLNFACSHRITKGLTGRSRPSASVTVIDANRASMPTSFGARSDTPLVFVIVQVRSSGWPSATRSVVAVTASVSSEGSKSCRSAACGAPVGNQLANGHPPGRMTGSGMWFR